MEPHLICTRIRIARRDGRPESPGWTNEQINKIAKQSPLFERQVLRLMQDSQYEWEITLKETDNFPGVDLAHLFVYLGRTQNNIDEMDVNNLSIRCSAMWNFEVVPSKVHLAVYATDDAGEKIASSSPTPMTSSAPTLAIGDSASPRPTVSENSSSEPESWCWKNNGDHISPETHLKLANIALVLNWREVFKREIKIVIWNCPETPQKDIKTPIQYLQQDGMKGLKRRREREMKEIRDWFDLHFTDIPKLSQHMKDMLRDTSPGKVGDPNPYLWMRSLEHTLLLSPKPPRHDSGDHHRGGGSGPRLSQVIQRLAIQISRLKNKKLVEDKLTEAHNFIEERQDEVAEKLLAWRDRQVARWENVLAERELDTTPNGVIPPEIEVESNGPEQQQQQPEGSPPEVVD